MSGMTQTCAESGKLAQAPLFAPSRAKVRRHEGTAPEQPGTSQIDQYRATALKRVLTRAANEARGPMRKVALLLEVTEAWTRRRALDRLSPRTRRLTAILSAIDATLKELLNRAVETGDALGYRPGLVDLADIVEMTIGLSRPRAHGRNLVVSCNSPGRIVVAADSKLLQQAIDHLVSHIVRRSRRNGVVLCEVSRNGREAIVRVSDEGRVSSGVDTARIFDPFSSVAQAPATIFASPDLKLWLARLVAERHGGSAVATPDETGAAASLEIRLPMDLT